MSNLNGESLMDWITSERKWAQQGFQDHYDDIAVRSYFAGIRDTMDTLKRKLQSGQVNPYGDENPISRD